MLRSWGFEVKEKVADELFNWVDRDADHRITYLDLRNSVGLEILPMETLFFRQDGPSESKKICQYSDCWEVLH